MNPEVEAFVGEARAFGASEESIAAAVNEHNAKVAEREYEESLAREFAESHQIPVHGAEGYLAHARIRMAEGPPASPDTLLAKAVSFLKAKAAAAPTIVSVK